MRKARQEFTLFWQRSLESWTGEQWIYEGSIHQMFS